MSSGSIAWIDGRWGQPDQLGIALNDRGVLLADGLFETVLIERRRVQLLTAHLQRWQQGARLLQMPAPPSAERVEKLMMEALQRSGLSDGALRLNWSRGSSGRGIDLPSPGGTARFWLQLSPAQPTFSVIRAVVSPTEQRCATSLLSRCKTFGYGSAIQARAQARAAGADEALLTSTAGGLCCGTTANLILEVGQRWFTPPLSSGCLPGVMRQRALELGMLAEADAPIGIEAVSTGRVSAAWLINSLSCRPLQSLNGHRLPRCDSAEAEHYWRRLLAP
ncbi:MAG: aminotransferase class IV [Cyanobacteriota bacterium]|nr:aminotransferase class IV [Cyanobacteriota bacterium]